MYGPFFFDRLISSSGLFPANSQTVISTYGFSHCPADRTYGSHKTHRSYLRSHRIRVKLSRSAAPAGDAEQSHHSTASASSESFRPWIVFQSVNTGDGRLSRDLRRRP